MFQPASFMSLPQPNTDASLGFIKIMDIGVRHGDNTNTHTAGTEDFCYIRAVLLRRKWEDITRHVLR